MNPPDRSRHPKKRVLEFNICPREERRMEIRIKYCGE
jgi:hypothetical protein